MSGHRLESALEVLKSQLGDNLIAAVLFGSRARGKRGKTSDWDLFLVAEGLPDNSFDRQLALRTLLPKDAGGVSIVAKTKREFESNFPPLYLDLATDGLVLYDSQDYIKNKLIEIRGIIQKAGLKRTRRRDSLIWQWEKRPAGHWRIDWSGVHGLQGRGSI